MQGGQEEEIIETGRNDDEQDEQEDLEVGRRKIAKLLDPKPLLQRTCAVQELLSPLCTGTQTRV